MPSLKPLKIKHLPPSRGPGHAEMLEARRFLSVTLDLSLQDALWTTSDVNAADVAPFRIDAVRVSDTAYDPNRIDGIGGTPPRIDGPSPNGIPGSSTVDIDELTFSQVILGSAFSSRPFERGDADVHVRDGVKDADLTLDNSTESKPEPIEIDWSRFEVFQNVSFTFAGGQIRAGLPTESGLVSVRILVGELPPGVTRANVFRSGTGVFLARLEALSPEPPVDVAPKGNSPLGIAGDTSGEAPASPPAVTPAPAAPVAPAPVNDNPGTQAEPGAPASGSNRETPASNRRLSTGPTSTIALSNGQSAERLGVAQGIRIAGLANAARNSTAMTAGPAESAGQLQPTALLPDLSSVKAPQQSIFTNAAEYLAVAAGSQLSALSAAAERLFEAAGGSGTPATPSPEFDYDVLRRSAPFAALGLSPWQVAVRSVDSDTAIWKLTAGVSFMVALSGYWYCKEYSARQRQARLAACRAIGGKDQHRVNLLPPAERPFIGRVSRIWRDEVSY